MSSVGTLDVKTKMKNIFKKLKNKRFKWEYFCNVLDNNVSLEELYILAQRENIPYFTTMTKRELCAEFSKRAVEKEYKKKNIQPKCLNDSSIFSMENLDLTPPEFFFSYNHNGQLYCDDIRFLYKHFKEKGPEHPIDRTKVSSEIINVVNKEFKNLLKSTVRMDDLNQDIIEYITPKNMLISNTTTLFNILSQQSYPNNLQLFIESDFDNFHDFIHELKNSLILTKDELIGVLNTSDDLVKQKIKLVDTLLFKINNQPDIEYDITYIYNKIYGGFEETETNSSETESEYERSSGSSIGSWGYGEWGSGVDI